MSLKVLGIFVIREVYNIFRGMDQFIERLEGLQNWKDALRAACKLNKLCTSLAGELTPGKLSLLRERFKKAYEGNQEGFSDNWIEHEMRAFNWILIALSALENVKISEFGHEHWKRLYQIFAQKSVPFLRYQTRRFLLSKAIKNKNWAPDENQCLREIIQKTDKDKICWNQVARKLFEESKENYFRVAKHCRQHWLNYLDPSKKRGDWTPEQDLQLLGKVQEVGKKWAKLGAQLNRTQHCVKNRFNSLLAKQKKLTSGANKEERLIELAKRALQPDQLSERDPILQPQIRVKLKMSSESMFDDNRSFNRQQCIGLHEVQPKNSLDYLQNYSIQGQEFVRHLVKDDEQGNNKAETTYFPSFWCNSPKNLTPMGISPSPLGLNNYGISYYLQTFNQSIQNQNEKQGNN